MKDSGKLLFKGNQYIDKYIGKFRNNKFNGQGKLYLKDKVIYKGEFENNLI